MKQYDNFPLNEPSNKQVIINIMYAQLTSSIKFAYEECSSTTTINKLKKKKWFTQELKLIKNKMLVLRHKQDKTQNDYDELKVLKKSFKIIMKKNIFLYEKNELFKIEKLIKCKNSESFFKKVNKELNKDKDNITLNIDDLANHYSNIFNRPLNVSDEINDFVNSEIQDVNIDNYIPIEISKFESKSAIKQTKYSNVCGNDGI
jgi:hypothetical protein